MKKPILLTSLAIALLMIVSCSKETTPGITTVPGDNILVEEDFTEAEMIFVQSLVDDEENAFDGAILRGNSELGGPPPPDSLFGPPCATRTWSGDSMHRVLTVDFGSEPCLCHDGRYRSGKVITHFIGPRRHIGSKRVVTFENYVVDRHHIGGTRTTTFVGDATFEETVRNGFVTFRDTTSTWNSIHLIRTMRGFDTPPPFDDVIRITGTRTGTNRLGTGYRTEIAEPLVRVMERGCARFFVDGVRRTVTDDDHVIILDFDPIGGAPCDDIARITIDGESRIIHLH